MLLEDVVESWGDLGAQLVGQLWLDLVGCDEALDGVAKRTNEAANGQYYFSFVESRIIRT